MPNPCKKPNEQSNDKIDAATVSHDNFESRDVIRSPWMYDKIVILGTEWIPIPRNFFYC